MNSAPAKNTDSPPSREYNMMDKDFRRIQKIAFNLTGITLSDQKKNMVYSRIVRRLRALKLNSFSSYCDLIESEGNTELTDFINAITTNLTSFFRENHHFEYLNETVIPDLIKKNAGTRRIRIWSAGCSTGEEPYSISMVLDHFTHIRKWDVKILATDLDSNVVATARAGHYAEDRVDGIPSQYKKYINFNKADGSGQVKPEIQSRIQFNQLNLLHDWPMKGQFDVIFCRNVVIYFNIDTQKKLFDRYANILTTNGKLFIGHSESLHNVTDRFTSLGRTIYERNR
ncbi:CheR family methyltransferase [Agarilytica rhodophyticola]|uniref:CheR family methyltransferase n=1 Tax=Agarilytica rhodophyticola TaxID=1737490 RepID=UPI000B34217F|nr:protein-glutamate O-methyltransferase [Agarilytica rhodophyticola]